MRRVARKVAKKPSFVIMNRDAMYYQGMKRGDVVWTHTYDKAKTFNEPSKIKMLKRWKPEEKMQIVYCD